MDSKQVSVRPKGHITEVVEEISARQLAAYRANPAYVEEHANLERGMRQGSYGRRQLFELVQNGADAMLADPGGRITVRLTPNALYCANQGDPIDRAGVKALLHSNLSVKRGKEIGRFGLGFKSVLGVTDRPEFHCKAGSFAFDADESKKRISEIVPDAEHYPTLRVAHPIDTDLYLKEDPHLADMYSWATTVIRLPRDPSKTPWLSDHLAGFPAEFLLFCRHVGSVILEDTSRPEVSREITIKSEDKHWVLSDGVDQEHWKIFETVHRPTQEAKDEVGELAYRDELPLIWAVPTSTRSKLGRLWAFFPLGDETTLKGIVNAPWKTNDDRTNLLESEFNRELLQAAARLAVDNMAEVASASDPGRALDILPALRREQKSLADELITEYVYKFALSGKSIPDQSGVFRCPTELRLHPRGLPREILDMWSQVNGRPLAWVHPSVEEGRDRRPRVELLYEKLGWRPAKLQEWLLALDGDSDSIDALKPCIRIASALSSQIEESEDHRLGDFLSVIEACEILVDADGETICLDASEVFLPGDHQIVCSQIKLVHPKLTNDKEIYACLENLGLRKVTPDLELNGLLHQAKDDWTKNDWEIFWRIVRLVDEEDAVEILQGEDLKVKNLEGEFIESRYALLPGKIVPADGSRDAGVSLDTTFHKEEIGVLTKIGLASEPQRGCKAVNELLRMHLHHMRSKYYSLLEPGRSRPQDSYLEFEQEQYVGPLEPLPRLSDIGKAEFVESLIAQEVFRSSWTMRHCTIDRYPRVLLDNPSTWAANKYGCLSSSLGVHKCSETFGRDFLEWDRFFPVADLDPRVSSSLGVKDDPDELKDSDWIAAYRRAQDIVDDIALGGFYAFACNSGGISPQEIHCRINNGHDHLSPDEITVATAHNEFQALSASGTPCIFVQDIASAELLIRNWGMQRADAKVQTSISTSSANEAVLLLDFFPALGFHVDEEAFSTCELIECAELSEETITSQGKYSCPKEIMIDGNQIYWQSDIGIQQLLELIDDRMGLALGPELREDFLKQRKQQNQQKAIAGIRSKKNDEERLLGCLGVDVIKSHLPVGLIRAVEAEHGTLDDSQIARLALTVFGTDVLVEYKDSLKRAGFNAPKRWAGSRDAIRFVRSLGFSRPHAGYEQPSRPARLSVDGPMRLPTLHGYQREIVGEIHSLITGSSMDKRGLVSLPTGAGKTRVAVQAIIELIRDQSLKGPILWVAQTDELCEQAVQTWREVWRALGPERELTISRLWANNDAVEITDGDQVVVATIQKLAHCIESPEYDWLSEASVLIVDEAHGATTPAYTKLLRWQSVGRKEFDSTLLGLTATPFRGHSEEQTARLAGRFGKNRLDRGLGDDPYAYLQGIRVLSQVEHGLLKGSNITMDSSELQELQKLRKLSPAVVGRLADDAERNRTLLEDILAQPTDWPVLLFCASVEHAQTMAALLRMAGRTAAPVSAQTASGVRRDIIEKFRSGKIQVLTNYGVLTQGFDAPAVRVIYVARPTFSPNVYQQMIGRGLRGPLNGGKEVCRIVNVEDTFAQFGESLAFQDFEHLWTRTPA